MVFKLFSCYLTIRELSRLTCHLILSTWSLLDITGRTSKISWLSTLWLCLFVYWIDPNEFFFASMRQSDKVYHHTCIDITVNLDYACVTINPNWWEFFSKRRANWEGLHWWVLSSSVCDANGLFAWQVSLFKTLEPIFTQDCQSLDMIMMTMLWCGFPTVKLQGQIVAEMIALAEILHIVESLFIQPYLASI